MPPTNRRGFLHLAGRYLGGLGLASGLASLLAGCQGLETVADLGTSIGTATGAISPEDAESISKSARAVARSFKEITPQQEYYIGRTVGALVLSKYQPYADRAANRYVNLLGQTLACASYLPETFGGYHFLIQDSDEINALAAPAAVPNIAAALEVWGVGCSVWGRGGAARLPCAGRRTPKGRKAGRFERWAVRFESGRRPRSDPMRRR